MSSMAARLSRIEQQMGQAAGGRMIVLASGGVPAGAVSGFLASSGLKEGPGDLLVHIHRFAGEADQPIELLHTFQPRAGKR